MDFSIIAKSALKQSEFAELVGVARVTVNLWVNGRMAPHRYTKAKIAVVLDHLRSAHENGDLPLSCPTRERPAQLRAAVKSAAARAKQAATA